MTWFRLDDTWLMHPKVHAAGLHGRALWIAGGLHCAQQLTDGRIDKTLVAVLAAQAGVAAKDARVLVDVGLWEDGGDHWLMHDWSHYQPSREQVTADRAAAAERQKRARERARDKARESQGQSRRDSHVTNGVSHGPPDPTRPDPILSEVAGHPPPSRSSGQAAKDPRVEAAITLEAQRRLPQLPPPDHPTTIERRLAGLRDRLAEHHRAELEDLAERHPDWTADQLAMSLRPLSERTVAADESTIVALARGATCPTCGDQRCHGTGWYFTDPDDRDSPPIECATTPIDPTDQEHTA